MTIGAGCAPTVTYGYRLTVEVETRQGLRSGSSVIETTTRDTTRAVLSTPEARMVSSKVRGEAVFVDLGEGRNVVAILARGPHGEGVDFDWLVPGVFGRSPLKDPTLAKAPGVHEVPSHLVPTLVSFSDPANPRSAWVVRNRAHCPV